MNSIFRKLHLVDYDPVLVLNAPEEYYNLLEELDVEIHDEVQDDYSYVQVFAQEEEEAKDVIREAISSMVPGAYFWFCYPKSKSEIYETELDEDSVMKIFDLYNFEGVTKVSLNEDWHAIRVKPDDEDDDDFNDIGKGPRKFNNLAD